MLTTQCLGAAGIVSTGPAHSHKASFCALWELILVLTLHWLTLHRHRAGVAYAGLAVADPVFSRLKQAKLGPLKTLRPQSPWSV